MEIGGPLYGGINSAWINVGVWLKVPEFHLDETILEFNIAKVLLIKQSESSVFILEVGPDEATFCFISDRAKDLNGVLSQCTVKATVVRTATTIAIRCKLDLRKLFIFLRGFNLTFIVRPFTFTDVLLSSYIFVDQKGFRG